MKVFYLFLFAILIALTSCADTEKEPRDVKKQGENGGICYTDGTCNEGLRCNNNICEIYIDPCLGIACDNWEKCVEGICTIRSNRCERNNDCMGNQICDVNHNCVNPLNPCEGQSCSNFGECTIINNTAKCNCNEGYDEDGLSCIPDAENICLNIICDEWKECNSANGVCELKEGRCESNNDCEINAICDVTKTCIETVSPCNNITCSNHGVCVVENDLPKCICNEGFTAEGLTCVEIIVDLCENIVCDEWKECNSANGQCVTKENRCSNNGECLGVQICDENHNCVNPIDPCEGQNCSNLGVCAVINNTAKCFCNNGYTAEGLTCVEIIVDLCENITCDEWKECNLSNGQCVTKENRCSNNGECLGVQICDENHNCVNPIDPCEGQSCSNLGVCAVINNTAKCFCNNGYTAEGLTCVEIIVDLCENITCDEWKECNSSNGQCQLKTGRCERTIECIGTQVCNSNHTCVEQSITCEGQSCSNLGVCAVINNTAKCFCNNGYTAEGLTCVEIIVDLCENIVCDEWKECNSTNGQCVTKENRCSNNGECLGVQICDENHNCVNPINPCEGQSCSNLGVCAVINNTAKCFCNNGYTAEGLTCVDINECEENTDNCQAGFTCENTTGGFICNDVNECDLNNGDCSHYCINAIGYYTCSCNERYYLDMDGFNCKPNPFITTWKTYITLGFILSKQITIPTNPNYSYNYNIDCDNDGINEAENVTGNYTCNYETGGIYQVAITGDFPAIYFNFNDEREKILAINQWGAIKWLSMNSAFMGCNNLIGLAQDTPDLSLVTDMERMFAASSFNQDINNWDVSNVTNMQELFIGQSFNQNISNWNVSNVTNMSQMFAFNYLFNQDLSLWDVSNVTDMSSMFSGTSNFNGDLSNWNVSNVINMSHMFETAMYFNSDLSNWNVSNVINMSGMFNQAGSFNSDLSNWDVSNVLQCYSFDYDTIAWTLPKPNFTSCQP